MSNGISPMAVTSCGRVRGEVAADLRVWRGIRYARPPVGELRFRAPQPPEPWPDIRSATEAAPMAWQSEALNPLTGQSVVPRRAEFDIWAGRTWTSGTWWDLGL